MYYFGLGFIQVVLNQEERVHFYNEQLEQTTDGIHNHRYNFKSNILKGHFLESRFKLVEGKKYLLTNENCGTGVEINNNISIEVNAQSILMPNGYMSMNYFEGDSYNMWFNEFHNVSYRGNTITHLTRGPIINDYAQVLQINGEEPICPFAIKYDNKILWEVIEDTIKK